MKPRNASQAQEVAVMREIRVKFPHYWIELPADLPVIAMLPILQHTGWRIRWNHQLGAIQIH